MVPASKKELILNDGDVQVWNVPLSELPVTQERLHSLLSSKECDRALRFRFEKDRRRFIACRGLLRWILSLYVGEKAENLHFVHNAFGKPKLRNSSSSADGLNFNYSHSHNIGVFAVAREKQVGIDVELIRPDVLDDAIPEHFFNSVEVASIRALPLQQQSFEFFRYWTRKEAYVKARGEGLQIPLNSFTVCRDRVQIGQHESEWLLNSFTPAVGYMAALATEGQCSSTSFIHSPERFFVN